MLLDHCRRLDSYVPIFAAKTFQLSRKKKPLKISTFTQRYIQETILPKKDTKNCIIRKHSSIPPRTFDFLYFNHRGIAFFATGRDSDAFYGRVKEVIRKVDKRRPKCTAEGAL